MIKVVKFDLERLIKDGNTRTVKNPGQPTYPRDFGKSLSEHPKGLSDIYDVSPDGKKYGVRVVSQEDAKFINLFGLFVDIYTGNIALGLFPDSDNYVVVGNLYSMLSQYLFAEFEMPEWVDKRYLLELLKLTPGRFVSDAREAVPLMYQENSRDVVKYDSILMNIASEWVNRTSVEIPHELKNFNNVTLRDSGDLVMRRILSDCISTAVSLEALAVQFFTVFISEKDTVEVSERMEKSKKMSLGDILNDTSVGGNLETLYLTYLNKYGIPAVFLKALKSYGLGIKQRKSVSNTVTDRSGNITVSSLPPLLAAGESLSSMLYLYTGKISGGVERNARVAGFNIIDLLKTMGWEESMLFSLDMVQEMHNRSVYDSLVKRFSIEDLLLETKTSMKDFVMSLDIYRKTILPLIDGGSLYTRKALPTQYALSTFSSKQVDAAGRVFADMSRMILRKF